MIDTQTIVLGIIALIVSIVSVASLRRHSFFSDGSSLVVGICVGLLSAIALNHELLAPGRSVLPSTLPRDLDIVLIPYATLGLTLLFVLLILILVLLWKWCARCYQGMADRFTRKSRKPLVSDAEALDPLTPPIFKPRRENTGALLLRLQRRDASHRHLSVVNDSFDDLENPGSNEAESKEQYRNHKHGGLQK